VASDNTWAGQVIAICQKIRTCSPSIQGIQYFSYVYYKVVNDKNEVFGISITLETGHGIVEIAFKAQSTHRVGQLVTNRELKRKSLCLRLMPTAKFMGKSEDQCAFSFQLIRDLGVDDSGRTLSVALRELKSRMEWSIRSFSWA
jgi:hypothetical protein